jgi:hypothetical protein
LDAGKAPENSPKSEKYKFPRKTAIHEKLKNPKRMSEKLFSL